MKYDFVIVDTGVDMSHPCFIGKQIDGISIDGERINKRYTDDVGHGTAITNIICRHCPKASIFVIKVFDDDTSDINDLSLLNALKYIDYNIDCKVVNISLGTNVELEGDGLYQVCKRLYEKGIYLVSAFDNKGSISFPAYYDCVLGVDTGEACTKISDYIFTGEKLVNIYAHGSLQRLAWLKQSYIVSSGNSYACAHASGIIYNLISGGKLLQAANTEKQQTIYESNNTKFIKRIKRAAVFPFNKEIHSLIRFRSMLQFEILQVYDIKYSAHVGVSTNKALNIEYENDLIIQNINDIDWDSIDTLIIGHISQIMLLTSENANFRQIILEGGKKGKKIFSFDRLEDIFPNAVLEMIEYTWVHLDPTIVPNKFGKMFYNPKPVLGVMGTSTMQGKYTLQLGIRSELLRRGYRCGQIGTEPTAELFGMDACFHYGFHSDIKMETSEKILYLNELIYNISKKDNDIIIVGGQSGTIITNFANVCSYHYAQYEFLLGTLPDAIVLVINFYDEIETVIRAVKFMESSIETRVIAIAVFPINVSASSSYGKNISVTDSQFSVFAAKVKEAVNLPVFRIGSDVDKLCETVIEYFG